MMKKVAPFRLLFVAAHLISSQGGDAFQLHAPNLKPLSALLDSTSALQRNSHERTARPKLLTLHATAQESTSRTHIVWLTGHGDLRLHDHGGFSSAIRSASDKDVIVPVFVLDPQVHLRCRDESFIKRLHTCLSSLEQDIATPSSSPLRLSNLVVRCGSFSSVLPSLASDTNAISCHVIGDDVVVRMRDAQRLGVASLEEQGVEIHRWTNCLRPNAPWSKLDGRQDSLPSFFPEYCAVADGLDVVGPEEVDWKALGGISLGNAGLIQSDGIPSLNELLAMASAVTPTIVTEAVSSKRPELSTTEPYEALITNKWCTERGAREGLEEYCNLGRDAFANKYFGSKNVAATDQRSLYSAAALRILREYEPSKILALRETATRAFSSALKLGVLSSNDIVKAAKNKSSESPFPWGNTKLLPSDDPIWGRSSEGSLHDVVEWREWFLLLAERSLALQEQGLLATSGGEKVGAENTEGDAREEGKVNYWRWKAQHLVRYITWDAGEDYEKQDKKDQAPAILLVHGFAASAEQWSRLVYSLRSQTKSQNNGKDFTPPIFAIDLLGFGHSEKPGLSYTQYLWESQLIDFVIEVMEAAPVIMAGNSIGGGISAGAAASLGSDIVRGLVLCNTAGVLEDPDSYSGYVASNDGTGSKHNTYTEAALEGNPDDKAYTPVPLFGNNALDAFGTGIVKLIGPQIEDRLSVIYGNRMANADVGVVYAIQQGAASPGSANVIGSGQKLAPNRPLNEILVGTGESKGFPVLVVMGLDDRVSSPQAARSRAELFSRLSPGRVIVKEIEDAGHCPHDDAPEKVASAILRWPGYSDRKA